MRPLPALPLLALAALAAACGREVRTDAEASAEALRAPEAAAMPGAAAGAGVGIRTALEGALGPEPEREGPGASFSVLYSERDAELRSRARGVVTTVLVELGDAVRQGQLLARLDAPEQAAALADAEAAYDLALVEHGRIVALQEAELIEAAALDRARYELRSAEARRRRAQALLDHTFVRAPFDGVVSRRFVRLAETVEPGDPLFRVTAMSPLRVRLMVPERHALALEPGREAVLRGAAGMAGARVLRVAPAVDPAGGTVEVLLEVPRPGELRPGSAVQVEWRP